MPGKGQRPASTQPAPLSGDNMITRPGLAENGCRSRYIPSEGVVPPITDAGGHVREVPACRSLSRHHCATARSAALNSPCAALSPVASAKRTKQLLPTPPPIKNHPKSLCTDSICHISTKIYRNSTDPSSVDQNTATNHSAQESIRPREGWGPPESMAHHGCTPA